MDDLVDVVLRDKQTLEQVGALLRLLEVVFRAPDDDLLLEGEVFVDDMAQGEDLRLALVLDKSMLIANVVCSCVCANRRLSTTCAFASRLSSITTRIPLRSDSSRMSEMPSSRLSST